VTVPRAGRVVQGIASEDFVRLADSFRRELLAHCYRMVGSVHDAEDLVQETYLRAWRSHQEFEGRSSLRTWLYRIATNACLTALERSGRRPLPSGLGGPSDDPQAPIPPLTEVAWLQPIPDSLLEEAPDDPAAIVASRHSVRLAFVAALQHLPPRQRAVLLLRDVLALRAAEVAEMLDTTSVAVNSTLQRARAQLAQVNPAEDETAEPSDAEHRELLDKYVAAFENADMAALAKLLRADAAIEMPPIAVWFSGRDVLIRFFESRVFSVPRGWRMLRTRANGQPAVATYLRDDDGVFRAHGVQLLALAAGGIQRITAFRDVSLFAKFGLPLVHDGTDS